jgi:zinc and cadmium transporter
LARSFLELLPKAFGMSDDLAVARRVILAGLLIFFVLEKAGAVAHCHQETCEGHVPPAVAGDHGRSARVIIIGDTFHNLVDGVLIAAAFLANHHWAW